MNIQKLVIKNFKVLRSAVIDLNPHLNIIVGDNEAGKTTLLEAIHLALSGQMNGRSIQHELTPHHFNAQATSEYFQKLDASEGIEPPILLIEAYLTDDESMEKFKGTNNSLRENCPGLCLKIELDEEYKSEYEAFIRTPGPNKTLPIEYFKAHWHSFSGNPVTSRSAPIKTTYIDTGSLRAFSSTDRYIASVIDGVLDPKQRVELSLAYRKLKEDFLQYDSVQKINAHLQNKKGDITSKGLSVAMDMSSHSAWESILAPHLDDIPLVFAGKGEQSAVNIKLAVEGSGDAQVVLIEEPENHQSFTNMNGLINRISKKTEGQQIVIATHSSFVLNKLGVENVVLFNRGKSAKLDRLTPDTRDYFMKLPGHDTLRLILAKRAILVEGPSDELIVQKAYLKRHGLSALEHGTDVIAVESLAFKRFLEIGVLLDLDVRVITDNDGNIEGLKNKYKDFLAMEKAQIYFDEDENCRTLEPQLLKANSLPTLNGILGVSFDSDAELLVYMKRNKTDCALRIFNSDSDFKFPDYINRAIE